MKKEFQNASAHERANILTNQIQEEETKRQNISINIKSNLNKN
jgi:hypothetical protein